MVSDERSGAHRGAMCRLPFARRGRWTASWRVVVALTAVMAGSALRAAEFAGEESLPVREAMGAGIHAYHAGDFHRAYEDLTDAVAVGAEDPRVYYFRGLAALRLGRTSEAQADFATGSDRELLSGGTRRVSQSLERVQGPDRLTLERFRSRARLGALQREREAFGRRYSGIEDAASDVRRRRRPEDIRPELVAPGGPLTGLSPAGIEEVPPPAAKPAAPPKPAVKPAPKPSETFGDEPAEESDDPFGGGLSEPAEESEDETAEGDVQEEEMDAEVEDTEAEQGVQSEEMDAEVEDTEAEQDVQDEVDAAAGQ